MASGVNVAALAQNATSGNTTVGNSTESLTTSEERGAVNMGANLHFFIFRYQT
jgi:hypothetical protein